MYHKILIVVTNQNEYSKTGEPTGLWLSELTHFYHRIKEANIEVTIASILGGKVPIDPNSISKNMLDAETEKYYKDDNFMSLLNDSLKLTDVNTKDFDVIYFTGGHGTMWDFPNSKVLQDISYKIYAEGGIISAVCHGVGALLNIKDNDGNFLIKGKNITGYSNKEEVLAKALDKIPFKLEDELKNRGSNYKSALLPFTSYVISDERIITGQNPQSTKEVAKAVLKALN
jgi:putative intracellular protease/amidase